MRRSPYRMGEPPAPCCDSYGNRSFQTTSPDVVSAAVPSAPKCTYTRSPSTIGVGDAQLFFGLMTRGLLTRNTSMLTTSRPVSTSNASARSDTSRCPVAAVSQTRPPATTGEDHQRPGIGVFHMTLRDSLHSLGRPCSTECPCPPGPRN